MGHAQVYLERRFDAVYAGDFLTNATVHAAQRTLLDQVAALAPELAVPFAGTAAGTASAGATPSTLSELDADAMEVVLGIGRINMKRAKIYDRVVHRAEDIRYFTRRIVEEDVERAHATVPDVAEWKRRTDADEHDWRGLFSQDVYEVLAWYGAGFSLPGRPMYGGCVPDVLRGLGLAFGRHDHDLYEKLEADVDALEGVVATLSAEGEPGERELAFYDRVYQAQKWALALVDRGADERAPDRSLAYPALRESWSSGSGGEDGDENGDENGDGIILRMLRQMAA
jgi:hypothetical protein